jgi:hypothetical protein
VLYHGVLAPHAGWRARVVTYGVPPAVASPCSEASDTSKSGPRHWAWAALMRRAFDLDVLACPRWRAATVHRDGRGPRGNPRDPRRARRVARAGRAGAAGRGRDAAQSRGGARRLSGVRTPRSPKSGPFIPPMLRTTDAAGLRVSVLRFLSPGCPRFLRPTGTRVRCCPLPVARARASFRSGSRSDETVSPPRGPSLGTSPFSRSYRSTRARLTIDAIGSSPSAGSLTTATRSRWARPANRRAAGSACPGRTFTTNHCPGHARRIR